MIGVISKDSEIDAVKEFFELFKTHWEPFVRNQDYELVITTTGEVPAGLNARLVAVYGSRSFKIDHQLGLEVQTTSQGGRLEYDGTEFPLYGAKSTFQDTGTSFLLDKDAGEVVGCEVRKPEACFVRVGYDLFQEVSVLLSKGQPPEYASTPTTEMHISILRSIMTRAGLPFVEVLPAPSGYDFVACLTHDVDFVGIREHKFDWTMLGFLYRALVVSFVMAVKGTLSWSRCWTNWQAAFSLPLVFVGLKDDFWLEFDRYMEIEKGLGSTFFFIPFKDDPGTLRSSPAPKRRAAKYDLGAIKGEIAELLGNGCEVGLHGVDAWQDSEKAKRERDRICEVTGQAEVGVRMHWLYFDEESPSALEGAGLRYDSTLGYNDAVGFRAGTAQVFGIPSTKGLLELPLCIQDTALFYPDRMNLSESDAMASCRHLIRQVAKYGGVLTLNWHTRSLSPERLWREFYERLINEMHASQVWFCTAGQAVNWFQSRRALRFESSPLVGQGLCLVSDIYAETLPQFCIRVYQPASLPLRESGFVDIPWNGQTELTFPRTQHSEA